MKCSRKQSFLLVGQTKTEGSKWYSIVDSFSFFAACDSYESLNLKVQMNCCQENTEHDIKHTSLMLSQLLSTISSETEYYNDITYNMI